MTEQTNDAVERALDDLCRLDDEFGLTPEDVRWVRERAQTIRAALAAAGTATGNSAFPVADDAVERAARALIGHRLAWGKRSIALRYEEAVEVARVALAAAGAGAGAEVDREALATRARRAADTVDASDHPDCDHRRWDCDRTIEAWSDGEKFTTDDLRTLADLAARGDAATPTEVEWGIYWENDTLPRAQWFDSEDTARLHAAIGNVPLIQRDVRRSTWREVEGGGQRG